ncbi:MAG TPA: TetR/AcrR family transcriptional regulator C-terminal ligand-binding domain-containing protein [Acidimicrobiales bacterium]|nr:TetR/AcrR family transcriptional regulator C-terminal ligand-binding domain-containing protein [Acidimicrobiales bacterium]
MDPRVERTRGSALRAAHELFDEGGCAAVTHAAVAARSGVGRATLYRHWPTQEMLVLDVVRQSHAEDPFEPTGELRKDLYELLDRFRVRLLDPAAERHMAATIERATADPGFAEVRASLTAAFSEPLVRVLKAAVSANQLERVPDVAAAVDQLVGPVAFRHFFRRRRLTRSFVRQVVDDFVAGHSPSPPARARPGHWDGDTRGLPAPASSNPPAR